MDKKKLIELAEKLGIKKENAEFGLKENSKEMEKTILEASKFMGIK